MTFTLFFFCIQLEPQLVRNLQSGSPRVTNCLLINSRTIRKFDLFSEKVKRPQNTTDFVAVFVCKCPLILYYHTTQFARNESVFKLERDFYG